MLWCGQCQTENCVKICHLLPPSVGNNTTFVALIHIDCHQPPDTSYCLPPAPPSLYERNFLDYFEWGKL